MKSALERLTNNQKVKIHWKIVKKQSKKSRKPKKSIKFNVKKNFLKTKWFISVKFLLIWQKNEIFIWIIQYFVGGEWIQWTFEPVPQSSGSYEITW